jgi:hypothetical protein
MSEPSVLIMCLREYTKPYTEKALPSTAHVELCRQSLDAIEMRDERMASAHAMLLTIWPDGEQCEHSVAREIFRTLAGGRE